MSYGSYFTLRIKPGMKTSKEMLVIGTGFQHLIDSYLWYLPFASVRQCKYVMEMPKILTMSGWPNVRSLLKSTRRTAHASRLQRVSKLGCSRICSSHADPSCCSLLRAPSRLSCLIRVASRERHGCAGKLWMRCYRVAVLWGHTLAPSLAAVPCGLKRLAIKRMKMEPKKPVQTTVLSRLSQG